MSGDFSGYVKAFCILALFGLQSCTSRALEKPVQLPDNAPTVNPSATPNPTETPSPIPTPSPSALPSPSPCTPGAATQIRFQLAPDANGQKITQLQTRDEISKTIYFATEDNCGNFISNLTPTNLYLKTNGYGFIGQTTVNSATVYFNQNSTQIDAPIVLHAGSQNFSGDLPIDVRWTIDKTPDLITWYRADSSMPLFDEILVGNNYLPWKNLSTLFLYQAKTILPGGEARFKYPLFYQPTLKFCGQDARCAGVYTNTHLRFAQTFDDFANKDLTVMAVVARANREKNFIISNTTSGNRPGLFLGWTSEKNLRFGLNGQSGPNKVDVTTPKYSGTPTQELIVIRMASTAGNPVPGISVSLNGKNLYTDSKWNTQQASSNSIPVLGSTFSETKKSQFYLSEFLIYDRALETQEINEVSQFLINKYKIIKKAIY